MRLVMKMVHNMQELMPTPENTFEASTKALRGLFPRVLFEVTAGCVKVGDTCHPYPFMNIDLFKCIAAIPVEAVSGH